MPKRVEYAYNAWKNQRRRCNGKTKDKTYHDLDVNYSSRDFINWFLKNTTEFDYKYVVGRIDHSKGYSFDNIRLETRRESSLEERRRNGSKKIVMFNKFTGEELFVFNSIDEAALVTEYSYSLVSLHVFRNKKRKRVRRRASGAMVSFKYFKGV